MTSWSFGGTTLATFGKVTVINEYLDLPDRRGDNITIPFRHGTIHTPKFYDQRVLTFGIAITGTTAADVEGTFDDLRALLSVRTPQTLSMTMEDATVRTAQATVDSNMDVERATNTLARVVVEFTLCEPYFRSNTLIADNTTLIDASPTAMVFDNTGTIEERDPIITLTGPLSNTVITNSTNNVVLTYTGAIAGGEVVIIQTVNGEYTAVKDGITNVIGNVSHSGSSALMVLDVGENTLSIADDTATTGTVGISFYPPFV